jgi:hypothetical protein
VVAVLVAAPVAIAALSLIGRHWYPTGDQAFEMLRVGDVGGRHTPLVGAWSRFGWAHPGPWLFWFLAPFYRVLGVGGVLAGVAVINGACLVGAVAVAHRRGGALLAAVVGAAMSVLVYANDYHRLLDPWNPFVAFFPFVFLLLLVWSVLCGDLVMLPIAVIVGSFTAETHAAYLPLVGGLVALATVWCLVAVVRERDRGPGDRSPAARWLVIAAAVGFVAWLPPIIDQLSGGNNLRNLLAYSRNPNDPTTGWSEAFGIFGTELKPVGPWITGTDVGPLGFTVGSSVWPALFTLGAVGALGWVSWRRGNRDAGRLAIVVLFATALAVAATARVSGIAFSYVVHWWWGIAALAALSVAWSAIDLVRSEHARHVIGAVCAVGLVANVAVLIGDLPTPVPEPQMSTAVRALGPPTASGIDHGRRYLLRAIDPLAVGAVGTGVYFDLYERGFDVFVPPDQFSSLQVGTWRTAVPSEVDAIITLVDVPDLQLGVVQPPPGSTMIASYDPLTPQQRARALEIELAIRAQLGSKAPPGRAEFTIERQVEREAAGVPNALTDELFAFQRLGDGYAVYLSPSPPA